MFTDREIGLKIAYDRDMRVTTGHAQAIIDRKHAELVAAHAEIRRLRQELALERSARIAAELRIEKLLDTPI
jgi:hypothetical protein